MGIDLDEEGVDTGRVQIAAFGKPLRFEDRLELRGYFDEQAAVAAERPSVQFRGNQFLHRTGHPRFVGPVFNDPAGEEQAQVVGGLPGTMRKR